MGKVSLVTGGTAGIGSAIVRKIIDESEKDDLLFAVYGHNEDVAHAMKNEIPEMHRDKVVLVKADLSEYEGIDEVKKAVLEKTDHIDWLILNAGIGTYLKFDEYTPDIWENVMRTNVNVPVFLVKAFKPYIAGGGAVLFMGSHAGQATYSSSLVYSVSKAAVMFMAKSLVKQFDSQNVRVNAIAPGFIETRWQENRSKESYDTINRKIAAHRFGAAEEVASLCYEVLTNDYLNGGIYDIHGGYDYF